MNTHTDNYDLLINKLDHFIKKYYKNKAIRGLIYFATFILGLYLFVSLLEYFFSFPPTGRKVLLVLFLASAAGTLGYWVLFPMAKYLKLGSRINNEQAAGIIGKHFDKVQDKLLNVLQLKSQSENAADQSLILASINQKIDDIKPIPFLKAINISANRKYLKYAAAPLVVILLLLISAPNVLRESNDRLIRTNVDFSKQAPFSFEVKNGDDLNVVQYGDITIEVNVDGDALPEKVNALTSDYTYKLKQEDKNTFTYTFKKVQKNLTFQLSANGYSSDAYKISVLPKPSLINFDIDLDYPAYTGRNDEKKSNIGDLVMPEGTKVTWYFHTENTDDITLKFSEDTSVSTRQRDENMFVHSRSFYEDALYKILTSNAYIKNADSIGYGVTVIPDKYPSISVDNFHDSTNTDLIYFVGEASDDYGLTKVDFQYKVTPSKGNPSEGYKTRSVSSSIGSEKAEFDLTWNLKELNLQPGDRLSYHFIVWDNDQVNGRKFTKTTERTLRLPTEEEIENRTEKKTKEIENDLEDNLEKVRALKKEISNLKERLLQKKEFKWEDRKAFEQLLNKQKELQEELDRLKKEFEKNNKQQSELQEQSEEMKEKQEKLKEMFDEMMDEETKKLMEKIEELLKDFNQDEAFEQLEEFEMNNEQFEKNMERLNELYKELEFEKKLNETQQELDQLAKEQEELSEESKKENTDSEELSEKQEELNKKFDDVKKDMDQLEKMNKDLENPKEMDDFSDEEESIKKDMEQSKEQLQQNQKKNASQKQKSASDKMKQMSQQMSQMQANMQMKQLQIDIEATKQLLENLIKLSFDQEQLMDDIKQVNTSSPKYKDLIEKQHNIEQDFKMIEDSLHALSKRIFQLGNYVNKEVANVKDNMSRSIEYFAERQKNNGLSRQQYVMTGFNNLALLLDEILQNMQQQAASMMAGSQMCQKPGGSSSSFQKMRQQQQQMNEQMGKMKDGQKGKEGEQKKSGKSGQNGMSSEEIAKMARQQRMLRKQVQELNEKYNKGGNKPFGNLEELMEKMEKVEKDLVNRNLTSELYERLKDIEIRLLEAEQAEQKQERSPERKGQTAKDMEKEVPPEIEEYLKKRKAEIDLYQTVPPSLNPFYKRIVNDYFKSITKFTP